MAGPAALRTLALIIGVTLIVIGAGMAYTGHNQTQAAAEWNSHVRYCGSAPTIAEASQLDCPDNPYAGGGTTLGIGIALIIGGGIATRYGTQ